jgi:hypothetical protein
MKQKLIKVEDWFENVQSKVLSYIVMELNEGNEFSIDEKQFAQDQMKLLSTSSDTRGIKFSGLALHFQYFQTKFKKRALLTYETLNQIKKFDCSLIPINCVISKLSINSKSKLNKVSKLKGKNLHQNQFQKVLLNKSSSLKNINTNNNNNGNSNENKIKIEKSKLKDIHDLIIEKLKNCKINENETLKIASLGGGPANDACAFLFLPQLFNNKNEKKQNNCFNHSQLSSSRSSSLLLECDLYDLEKS